MTVFFAEFRCAIAFPTCLNSITSIPPLSTEVVTAKCVRTPAARLQLMIILGLDGPRGRPVLVCAELVFKSVSVCVSSDLKQLHRKT